MWKSKSMATSSFSLQGSDWEIGSKCGYIHSRHQCMWEKQTLATCFGFLSSHEGQNSETQRHHLCFHTRSNCTSPRRPRVRDKTKLVARAIINTWKPPEATEKGPKWGKQKNLTISEIGHGNGEMNTTKTVFFLVEKLIYRFYMIYFFIANADVYDAHLGLFAWVGRSLDAINWLVEVLKNQELAVSSWKISWTFGDWCHTIWWLDFWSISSHSELKWGHRFTTSGRWWHSLGTFRLPWLVTFSEWMQQDLHGSFAALRSCNQAINACRPNEERCFFVFSGSNRGGNEMTWSDQACKDKQGL